MPLIQASIDVTKIDKARIFEGKNGAKYIDLVLIETPNNRFGDDYMVVQGLPKEEREQGKRGPILGNAKRVTGRREPSKSGPEKDEHPPASDDVPF